MSIPVWKANPDLMRRLSDAQNALERPIDIMTFAGLCDTRSELERHVIHYEEIIAKQKTP